MRTNEGRIAALHSRTAQLKRERDRRDLFILCGTAALICLCILIGAAFLIPGVAENGGTEAAPARLQGSIFSGSSVLGYIVISILAFLLGITVTVFCFRLKKRMDEKDQEDSQ